MISNVYVVLDRVTGIYGQPVLFRVAPGGGHAEAVRWFSKSMGVIDEITKGTRCASDYALYYTAFFDDIIGMFKSLKQPEFLSSEVIESVKELVEKSKGELEV